MVKAFEGKETAEEERLERKEMMKHGKMCKCKSCKMRSKMSKKGDKINEMMAGAATE